MLTVESASFPPQLNLLLDDGSVVADSPCEWERILKPRMHIASAQLARLLALDDPAIGEAGVTARTAMIRLHAALKELCGEVGRVQGVMDDLGEEFFSRDQNWRAIVQQISLLDLRFNRYKLITLLRYHSYLLNTQAAINRIDADRFQSQICAGFDPVAEANTLQPATVEDGCDCASNLQEERLRDLVRAPKGIPLAIDASGFGPVELWLGKHRFEFESWDGATLVDAQGRGTALREGQNLIGRSAQNDVVVDQSYVDISRQHLILDLRNGLPLALTDLSSMGTYLPRALVAAGQSLN